MDFSLSEMSASARASYAASLDRVALGLAATAVVLAMWAVGVVGAQAQAAPDARAYERVSPGDKNGADIDRDLPRALSSTSGAAATGDAVAYAALGQFADIRSGSVQGQYVSHRGETGWTTRAVNPPLEPSPSSEAIAPFVWGFSQDLSRSLVGTNALLTPSASLLGGTWGLYAQDNFDPSSPYQLISQPPEQLPQEPTTEGGAGRIGFVAATSDMSHVVFEADGRRLVPGGPDDSTQVYLWEEGQLDLVSVLPSGEPSQGAMGGFAVLSQGSSYPGSNVISADGKRVFFTHHADHGLYMWEEGTSTPVSVSERSDYTGDPLVADVSTFLAAEASSGSKVLFQSPIKLTADAKACDATCPELAEDLYLWNADAPQGARLTDLTIGDPDGAGVLGLAGAADDMSRAYFVATGELAAGAAAGQPNLYTWSPADGVRHITVLDGQDTGVWHQLRDGADYRNVRISRDGNRLLFVSRAQLTSIDTGGRAQVYLYDADAGHLDCVSCGEGPVTGEAWLMFTPGTGARLPLRMPRNVTDDGERIFFETAESLVNGDTNGTTDVYMWSDGHLELISTGRGADGSRFIDASATGNDVFFTTREQLVSSDSDELVDVYDARVGGGFPDPPSQVDCVGDACQPSPTARPHLQEPGSEAAIGNLKAAKRAAFAVTGLSKASRKALARGRPASLVVRVNKAGRVTIHGTARVGKGHRVVLAAGKRARAAGKVTLRFELSRAGRRQLAQTGQLKVGITVRFSGAGDPTVRSVTLVSARGAR